jgi:Short C-terminal domain
MMRRVGRPGLVGTMARTAVVAGTATAVSGGMMRRSQQKAQAQADQQQAEEQAAAAAAPPPPPPPAPPAAGTEDVVAKLKELADLKAQGILSEDEFTAAKTQVLGE